MAKKQEQTTTAEQEFPQTPETVGAQLKEVLTEREQRIEEEELKAREEAFFRETSALMLHALVNRTTSLPTHRNAAEQATDYTEALVTKLKTKGVL